MVLLAEECSPEGDPYNCFRLAFIDIISVLMVLFCLYSIRKLYIAYQTVCFEIVCLSTAIITASLQFAASLFDQHIYMTYSSFYMQLVTYTIISFSLIKLYYRLQRKRKGEKCSVFLCISFLIFISLILILSYADVPKFDCHEIFSVHWLIFRACDILVTFLCFTYGLKLYMNTEAEEKRSKSESSDESTDNLELFKEEAYFTYQKKRLIFIVIAFMSTSVIGFIWDVLGQEAFYNDFYCENGFHLVPDNDTGVTFFLVRSLTFLVPCLLLMYGFYVMPVVKQGLASRKDDITFDNFGNKALKSGLLNHEDDINESQFLVSAPLKRKITPINYSAKLKKRPDEGEIRSQQQARPNNFGKQQSFLDFGLLSAHINNFDDESSDEDIQTYDKAETNITEITKGKDPSALL